MLLSSLSILNDALGDFDELRRRQGVLQALTAHLGGRETDPSFRKTIRLVAQATARSLDVLRERLVSHPYPFESRGLINLSIGSHVVPHRPAHDLGSLLQAVHTAEERMRILYFRILGQLGGWAESIELALGLAPIEIPAAPTTEADPPTAAASA